MMRKDFIVEGEGITLRLSNQESGCYTVTPLEGIHLDDGDRHPLTPIVDGMDVSSCIACCDVVPAPAGGDGERQYIAYFDFSDYYDDHGISGFDSIPAEELHDLIQGSLRTVEVQLLDEDEIYFIDNNG